VDITPQGHPNLVIYLSNLGSAHQTRFVRTGRMEDLEEAIRITHQAVNIIPRDHPALAGRLNTLSTTLLRRFERTGGMEDLEEAIRITP
jgi:hypothetical protein